MTRTMRLVMSAAMGLWGCGGSATNANESSAPGPSGTSAAGDRGAAKTMPGSQSDPSLSAGRPAGGLQAGSGGSTGAAGLGPSPAALPPPPPEKEETRIFEAPHAGEHFVYVANAKRDSVAVIDSRTLTIRTAPVGDSPTYLRTVAGKDVALVINTGTRDISILRTDKTGATVVTNVPVVVGANAIAVAPDGRHAIAWYDVGAKTPGVGSFQDVSLIKLDGGKDTSFPLTVGFKPTGIVFASDGTAAFIVTEDGISIVKFADVTGPTRARVVRVGSGAALVGEPKDVSVTPDGRYAVARRENEKQTTSEILLVDLVAGTTKAVDLGGFVTDLDVSTDGQFAMAVIRRDGTYVKLPIPEGFTDEMMRKRRKIPGETFGSATLSRDGKRAVLYTTADPIERMLVADLEAGTEVPVRLRKAVRAVALAPDGNTAVVVHTKVMGDPKATADVEQMIDRSFGYTVVNLNDGFAKLQLTDTEVGPLAVTPDGTRAFVLLSDESKGIRIAQRIHLASLLVDDFVMGSKPVSISALGKDSRKVFVSQTHPEGRLSFIDWESGAIDSVTGFELNGRIVQ